MKLAEVYDLAGEISLDDLMGALSDFLLDSGFHDPMAKFQELNGEQTMENLREAIRQALEAGDLLTDEQKEKLDNEQLQWLCSHGHVEHVEREAVDAFEPKRAHSDGIRAVRRSRREHPAPTVTPGRQHLRAPAVVQVEPKDDPNVPKGFEIVERVLEATVWVEFERSFHPSGRGGLPRCIRAVFEGRAKDADWSAG